jgi:beta-glucosidase
MQALRAGGAGAAGIVVNLEPKAPATPSEADRAATARAHAYFNRQFLDPLFLGRYPGELSELYGEVAATDFSTLPAQRPDFLGINYYKREVVRHDAQAWPFRAAGVPQPGVHTSLDWEIYPEGLRDILTWVRERYGEVPLYVTENGAASNEPLQDPLRTAYLRDHLLALQGALASGVDVRGYFVWSLLDNFEWAHGYSQRFGIVHVDLATQARTPKASAGFYSEVARSHGAIL